MNKKKPQRMPRSFDVDPSATKTPQEKKALAGPAPHLKTRRPKSVSASGTQVSIDDVDFFSSETEVLKTAHAFEGLKTEQQRPQLTFLAVAKWAIGLLFATAAGLWLEGIWREALLRNDWLGWAVSALILILMFALAGLSLREWLAVRGIKQVNRMREEAAAAIEEGNSVRLRAAAHALLHHFSNNISTATGRANLASLQDEILDGDDFYALHERELLKNIDQAAIANITAAVKRVSVVTALSPRALVDVGYVFYENTRLIRTMAELYGGRAGGLGTIKLTRKIITHLAVTGALSVGEGLLQQVLGQGLAARVSTRLGEGAVNGLLTARVGIAAMEVCRPAPFYRLQKPKISDFLARLVPAKKTTDGL